MRKQSYPESHSHQSPFRSRLSPVRFPLHYDFITITISLGVLRRFSTVAATTLSTIAFFSSSVFPICLNAGVSIGLGLKTCTRFRRSFGSMAQQRPKERTAAFDALQTLLFRPPLMEAADAVRIIAPPSTIICKAFCTVNNTSQ